MLVEEQLNEIKGVNKVYVSFHKGEAEIFYSPDQEPNSDQISEAIRRAGYSVGRLTEQKLFISKNKKDYQDLGIAFLFLVGIYFICPIPGQNHGH